MRFIFNYQLVVRGKNVSSKYRLLFSEKHEPKPDFALLFPIFRIGIPTVYQASGTSADDTA